MVRAGTGNGAAVIASDPALPEPDERPVVGRYELGPVIGIGSSAVVRRGRDLQGGEPVAVKLFRPGGTVHDRRQLQQELAALATLEHPGLIALHDGGTQAGCPFVVTDLVEGPTLAARIQDGPLPADEVRALGAQLADALAHVHAGGFVHRDIKPANVLLESGYRPRLADFGISRALESTAVTTEGCVVGTAAYLAPEQVRGEPVGPPADVYALGLLLLEALTGRREYPGAAIESATARLFRRPVVPDELPAELGRVLTAMTADDPAERPTAAEVATRLVRRRAAALVADAGGSTAPRWGRRRHRHRAGGGGRWAVRSFAPTALVLLALVAAACVLLAWSPEPSPTSPPLSRSSQR
jgi:eukaryotic-like serine/threonine-protein kinase